MLSTPADKEVGMKELRERACRLLASGQIDEAKKILEEVVASSSSTALDAYTLGCCFRMLSNLPRSQETFELALEREPKFFAARFGALITSLREIYENQKQLLESRNSYKQHLDRLVNELNTLTLDDLPYLECLVGSFHPFYLPYQGYIDKSRHSKFGKVLTKLMSSACLPLRIRAPREKPRVGFVSAFFRRHSVWKMPLGGWFTGLKCDKLEIFGYMSSNNCDEVTELARRSHPLFISSDFEVLKGKILEDEIDFLIYPEVGMDPLTIKLATLRLAPLQAASWGHPVTTGLPTIDYYLSSKAMESEIADSHYSEKLIYLKDLSVYLKPSIRKESFKFPFFKNREPIRFLCAQALYKYLPKYDYIFAKIAKRLPKATFIFIDRDLELTGPFINRLIACFKRHKLDYQKHLQVIPALKQDSFFDLCQSCDLFLDSIEWSGCNSSLEALENGLPTLTLPKKTLRSRHTLGFLKILGLEELAASSPSEYIDLAVSLGQDKQQRDRLSQLIAENLPKLYHSQHTLEDLENFICKQVNSL